MKYIQGDVIFRAINEKKINLKQLSNVVVKGLNSHILENGTCWGLEDGTVTCVVSEGNAVVVHPTHAPIPLPQGIYQVSIVKEYDHFAEEARNVKD